MSNGNIAERICVRGLVQGVGFRPTVWRLAQASGLRGEVWNDSQGVEIHVSGTPGQIDAFCQRLAEAPPPLARIDAIERSRVDAFPESDKFLIRESRRGEVRTGVVPDAAVCPACKDEIDDSINRRYRYPFTNCTHCGPRLSIVERIPYDRSNTCMRHFPMCPACQEEYENPADRRFHAQPNACPVCGPKVWLVDSNGVKVSGESDTADAVETASRLLKQGKILAIKGIGGFHLACDATDAAAVSRLRERKGRYHKPFALMAGGLSVIRRYCEVSDEEAALLQSPAAPIVLLQRAEVEPLPEGVAPSQTSLGFMLPYTPLHHLLMKQWDRPLVMTSGNRIEEPQCIDNREAADRLQSLADGFLLNDREITNRVDDSVARVMAGQARLLRRARGYAPAPIPLPDGFPETTSLLALGGELKNTFCLVKQGGAVVSQHLGDLENLISYQDYLKNLDLYADLYEHRPACLVADLHPNYRSSHRARELADQQGLSLIQVQHHHAHIASVLAENGWPLTGGKVLGIALDGSGYGGDGTIWGGEFLLADYHVFHRLGSLKPIALPGGTQAIRQPWRNAFSHLHMAFGWERVVSQWGELEPVQWLNRQPVKTLMQMITGEINSPLSSSCGRLFDGVAALLGICRESISYEGQAAIELEAMALAGRQQDVTGYMLKIDEYQAVWQLDAAPLWQMLLEDLQAGIATEILAWRFHLGLASAVSEMAIQLAERSNVETMALSGGVFQNRTLFELVHKRLSEAGFRVLTHSLIPTNDGGLSLGQAAIGLAKMTRVS
ncbi:MAG: carbamoyltransferase HypF [Candidatus Thiodiazotropha sp. (ex Monitilora ramsayi)]|nr:carbamoyltransferase HypF [Candidatus Thiodiazotropha sp. (ex Monitilora ramsayi)]